MEREQQQLHHTPEGSGNETKGPTLSGRDQGARGGAVQQQRRTRGRPQASPAPSINNGTGASAPPERAEEFASVPHTIQRLQRRRGRPPASLSPSDNGVQAGARHGRGHPQGSLPAANNIGAGMSARRCGQKRSPASPTPPNTVARAWASTGIPRAVSKRRHKRERAPASPAPCSDDGAEGSILWHLQRRPRTMAWAGGVC